MATLEANLQALREIDLDQPGWALLESVHTGATELFQKCVSRLEVLVLEPEDELPPGLVQQMPQITFELLQAGRGVDRLVVSDANFHRDAQRAMTVLAQTWTWWRNTARQHVRAAAVDLNAAGADAATYVAAAAAAADEAGEIRDGLRDLATVAGTLELAQHYSKQATSHQDVAKRALSAVALLGIALVLGGWFFIDSIPDTEQWTELVRDALARGFALGALSYGVAFSARVYRTNVHLRAVYEQKANALKTYNLFSSTVEGDDARMLILGELVRSVFSSADTGILDKGGDHTIVESAIPIATAMARAK